MHMGNRLARRLLYVIFASCMLCAGIPAACIALNSYTAVVTGGRLGIDSSVSSFNDYIEGRIHIGMLRADVAAQAELIGELGVDYSHFTYGQCESYVFRPTLISRWVSSPYVVCYDADGEATSADWLLSQ